MIQHTASKVTDQITKMRCFKTTQITENVPAVSELSPKSQLGTPSRVPFLYSGLVCVSLQM